MFKNFDRQCPIICDFCPRKFMISSDVLELFWKSALQSPGIILKVSWNVHESPGISILEYTSSEWLPPFSSGANSSRKTMEKHKKETIFCKNIIRTSGPGKYREFQHQCMKVESSMPQTSAIPAHLLNYKTGNSLFIVMHYYA